MNVEKALLPGLWSLLKEGGHGCASIAYPCLLPLVSRLMEKVCTCVYTSLDSVDISWSKDKQKPCGTFDLGLACLQLQ